MSPKDARVSETSAARWLWSIGLSPPRTEKRLCAFLPEAHRVRGEILFKRDPDDPGTAEKALLTAIDVAREQGSRSFGLRAALSLAKDLPIDRPRRRRPRRPRGRARRFPPSPIREKGRG